MILLMKPRLKKIGSIVAVLFGVLVFYILAEHVRGYWWLHRYVKQLEGQHEVLQVEPLVPKRVPDDQNAAVDLRRVQASMKPTEHLIKRVPPFRCIPGHADPQWKQSSWNFGKTNSCNWAWIGSELESNAVTLDVIRRAIRKPGFDSGVNFIRSVFPSFDDETSVFKLLDASVLYSLSMSRTEDAYRDLLLMIKLCVCHMREPFLNEYSTRLRYFGMLYNTMWNALQYPNWTDAQLAGLSEAWATCNFEKDLISATEMTRALHLRRFRSIRDSREKMEQYISSFDRLPFDSERDIGRFATSGWFLHFVNIPLWRMAWGDLDELKELSNWQQLINLERFYSSNSYTTIAIGKVNVDALFPINKNWISWFDRFRFILSEPHFGEYYEYLLQETFKAQTQVEMLRAAIAIQRYRLKNGDAVPPSLEALVPGFLPSLPQDRMIGSPLSYHVTAKNEFLLYSVGSNGINNNGNPTPASPGIPYRNLWDGQDAVWYLPNKK